MFKIFIAVILFAVTALASAQIPGTLTINKNAYFASVTGNLPMTVTTRPPGATRQRLSFTMRGTGFFFGGEELGAPRQWQPKGHQLWAILRGSGVADGRGILIGSIHGLAFADSSSGACPHAATAQAMLFASVQRLYANTCIDARNRLLDGKWYQVYIEVSDSKQIVYSIGESDSAGNIFRAIASAITVSAAPLAGNPDPAISGTGIGIGATNSGPDGPMTLELRNISTSWY